MTGVNPAPCEPAALAPVERPCHIAACECLTAFGDAAATAAALRAGKIALQLRPVLGREGGDAVPISTLGDTIDETLPPRWLAPLRGLAAKIPRTEGGWGSARRPVILTSSNFGVGSLHAFRRDRDARHLAHGPPFATGERLQRELGWGENVTLFSHACVTAHLGLAHAARLLHAALADEALVFSFDFVSPFVAGGFHSLKILNATLPAPFAARDIGAIGLGDGAAFAVLTRAPRAADPGTGFVLEAHALFNEMHHFTGNQPAGTGFAACAGAMAEAVRGRRVWIKGHGTGTLEAGRLEAETWARLLPGAPLVSWKGSLGHTLGSCGLVELAIAIAAWRGAGKEGEIPGTVGSEGAGRCFTDTVTVAPFAAEGFDAAVLGSNAFGGAHAAMVLSRRGEGGAAVPAGAAPALRAPKVIERFLHHLRVERPPASETAVEARERLRDKFPRAALRRMTHLGMLLGSALDGLALAPEDAVVYATTYAETRALEDFLASFPAASPLLFQTSIHPGGVQQVLIGRQQPVARLWPLAGRARLVEQAWLAALLEPAPRVVLLGGEERGTWLLEAGMASDRSFAFAAELTHEAKGAVARLRLEASQAPANETVGRGPTPDLGALADALAERRAFAWNGGAGRLALEWC